MNSDLGSAVVTLAIQLPLVGIVWLLLRYAGIAPTSLLTKDEWQAAGKLCVATSLLLLLLWRMLYSALPQELFIYGRF